MSNFRDEEYLSRSDELNVERLRLGEEGGGKSESKDTGLNREKIVSSNEKIVCTVLQAIRITYILTMERTTTRI